MALAPKDVKGAKIVRTSVTGIDILQVCGEEKRFIELVSISMRTDIAKYIADLINEDLQAKSFW